MTRDRDPCQELSCQRRHWGIHQSCQEHIRDIRDADSVLVPCAAAGLPAGHRGPGQPQGEAQGEVQDQEEQQQRGATREAEGNSVILLICIYSVFFFRRLQKHVCCELVFGLLGNPKTFLGPQDWEQMTIRPEILLNKIKIEF